MKLVSTRILLPAALAALWLSAHASAAVRLPNVIGNSMVLQQKTEAPIWGFADAGEKVTVQIGDEKHEATADDAGNWQVKLAARDASKEPVEIKINGANNEITITDVLVGEVWICSGQSNMEWGVNRSANPQEEIAAADYPNIRLFNVPGHIKHGQPQPNTPGAWQTCSPQTVAGFSAVGYYFGRELHKDLDVPIGLIGTNWGGTRIQPWTPPAGFEAVEEVKNQNGQGDSSHIYNAMVHGLAPYAVRGAIWYQGESNAGEGLRYEYLQKALVRGWRSVFQNDDLSFIWVQLANFQQPSNDPAGGGWGPVREGQRRALAEPKTGMAVIIDIGEAGDIHPKNKQDVGKRLALWALANDYGKNVVYSGPLYKNHQVTGDKVTIEFDHVGGGLMIGKKQGLEPTQEVADGKLNRFSIRDKDGKWHWAEAAIEGNTVVVSSPEVKEPTAVRYGYESNPVDANLYNKEGLPASPFTTVD